MTRWLWPLWAVCVAATPAIGEEEQATRWSCASLLQIVRTELYENESRPVPLQDPALVAWDESDSDSPCENFDRVKRALARAGGERDFERGRLGGQRAVVWSDGPHGSGHYWSVVVAVQLDSGGTVGACLTTSTSGWHNLSDGGKRLFGRWRTLTGDDSLHVWTTLTAGAAEWDSLLFPVVLRLVDGVLVMDRPATVAEIGRFARGYARAAERRDDRAPALHRAAAQAYRALAAGADCTP